MYLDCHIVSTKNFKFRAMMVYTCQAHNNRWASEGLARHLISRLSLELDKRRIAQQFDLERSYIVQLYPKTCYRSTYQKLDICVVSPVQLMVTQQHDGHTDLLNLSYP